LARCIAAFSLFDDFGLSSPSPLEIDFCCQQFLEEEISYEWNGGVLESTSAPF
jgi:hypothetical protein